MFEALISHMHCACRYIGLKLNDTIIQLLINYIVYNISAWTSLSTETHALSTFARIYNVEGVCNFYSEINFDLNFEKNLD